MVIVQQPHKQMKELSKFKSWLNEIIEKKLKDEELQFVWQLMKSPYVEFHYELLKNENLSESFRRSLSSRFDEHGENAENLLISKLDKNEDADFHGNIIFLLGKIKSKHKLKTLEFARKLSESENRFTREQALICLGWIGTIDDTKILEKHLLNDTNPKCRAWSASSFMQMWFKTENKNLKRKSFEAYKKILPIENDYFVLSVILSSIREIGKTKLGISQTALDELDTEKIDIAKSKATRFLDKALKGDK